MESVHDRSHARSKEEEDLLIKSNKNVQAGDMLPEEIRVDVEMGIHEPPFIGGSFKEKLMGRQVSDDEFAECLSEDDEVEEMEEGAEDDCPTIFITKEEKSRIRR